MTETNGQAGGTGDEVFRPGNVLSDRYELLREIGSGASAITWRARDRRLERDVAIKLLRRSYAIDPTFALRFDREARTAASVSHGNVVDIYDVGRDGDALFLVMQYVPGEDLKHLIQRSGALEPTRARAITLQVLAGLQAVHAVGIVHRDIKPQNVLIDRDDVARVTDFGVAQVSVDVGLTTVGTTVGTAAYMAPEQARGETLSEATDLYSVGVMLYELMTGSLPFTGPTHMAMMLAHIQQEPPLPSNTTGVSPIFDDIVRQAMAKLPRDRFRSAPAMARALMNATATPAQADSTGRTIQTGAATAPLSTTRSQRSGAWPAAPAQTSSPDLQWARQSAKVGTVPPSGAGGGLQIALWGFLLLIVLLLGAIGVYAYNEYFADGGTDDPTRTPAVQATRTAVDETAEPTQEPTDGDEYAPPIVPDDTEEPTQQPSEEPQPTDEPTDEPPATEGPSPTDEPIIGPVATEESQPIIVPDNPTETPAG